MANLEDMKRKAQSAAYTATEKAQDAANAAGEKASAFVGQASEKAENFRAVASEKAGAFIDYAGEKAGALVDSAKTGIALLSEKRSLEKSYLALGEWYAENCGEAVPEGAAELVAAIRASQEKIAELKARGASVEEAEETAEAAAEAAGEAAEEAAGDTPEA